MFNSPENPAYVAIRQSYIRGGLRRNDLEWLSTAFTEADVFDAPHTTLTKWSDIGPIDPHAAYRRALGWSDDYTYATIDGLYGNDLDVLATVFAGGGREPEPIYEY